MLDNQDRAHSFTFFWWPDLILFPGFWRSDDRLDISDVTVRSREIKCLSLRRPISIYFGKRVKNTVRAHCIGPKRLYRTVKTYLMADVLVGTNFTMFVGWHASSRSTFRQASLDIFSGSCWLGLVRAGWFGLVRVCTMRLSRSKALNQCELVHQHHSDPFHLVY